MVECLVKIPDRMRVNVVLYFGERGREWLTNLPTLLDEVAQSWSLNIKQPYPNLSINYVARATRTDGTEVVIKIGVPNREITTEISALCCFNGNCSVKLIEADAQRGVMLLECLSPGKSLLDLSDDAAATAIAAKVMGKLWRPPPAQHSFPTVASWFDNFAKVRAQFGGGSGPLPSKLFELAEEISRELIASTTEPVLLHGDCHHANIVKSNERGWLVIDPKGVIGDPAFEPSVFLRNPHGLLLYTDLKKILTNRLDLFSQVLGLDRERIIAWGLAGAVLSASWDLDDKNESWQEMIKIAGLFAEMR